MAVKIPITIYPTFEQMERLKALHRKTQVPVAAFIRQGIDLVLAAEQVGQLELPING